MLWEAKKISAIYYVADLLKTIDRKFTIGSSLNAAALTIKAPSNIIGVSFFKTLRYTRVLLGRI
jgi:hypothetical protein